MIKTIAGLFLSVALLWGGPALYVAYMKKEVMGVASQARPNIVATPNFAGNYNASSIRSLVAPNIDPAQIKRVQAIAVQSMARRVDLQIRATQATIPRPPSIPGLRRY